MGALPEPRPWSRAARTASLSPYQGSEVTMTRLSPPAGASVSLVAVDGERGLLLEPRPESGLRDLANVRTVSPAPAPGSPVGMVTNSQSCTRRHVLPFALTWSTVILVILAGIKFGLVPEAADIGVLGAMVGWALYIEVRSEH